MTPSEIARKHFDAALHEAEACACGSATVGRHMIDTVIAHFLKSREVDDVRKELQFMIDTMDPDTDFIFMRP